MFTFRYHRNKRTKWLTAMWCAIVLLALVIPYCFGIDNYLNAWVIAVVVAILALYILSIPSKILVDEHLLEIRCLVETTRIEIRDIVYVRKADRQEYKELFPLLGSYGFFGYYGYYCDFSKLETVKIYAGEWDNFVEIGDIYDNRYLVSCRESDALIEAVTQAKLLHASEN